MPERRAAPVAATTIGRSRIILAQKQGDKETGMLVNKECNPFWFTLLPVHLFTFPPVYLFTA
jgi:hypothetical protein